MLALDANGSTQFRETVHNWVVDQMLFFYYCIIADETVLCAHFRSDRAQTKWPTYLFKIGCQRKRSWPWRVPAQRVAPRYVIPCTAYPSWQLAGTRLSASQHPSITSAGQTRPEGILGGVEI